MRALVVCLAVLSCTPAPEVKPAPVAVPVAPAPVTPPPPAPAVVAPVVTAPVVPAPVEPVVAPAPVVDERYTFPMRAEEQCHPAETPCGMFVVDLAAGTVVTVSIVSSDSFADDAPRKWVARGAAGEVPVVVEAVADADPPGMLTRADKYADGPFKLTLEPPGHPLLPAPKAVPGVGWMSDRVVAIGEKFYAAASVRGKPGLLVEVDPTKGAVRALKAAGAEVVAAYPAGDKLVVLFERAGKSTIGVYDVVAEGFEKEITLPEEPRKECESVAANMLGIYWLAVTPDASRVRATFQCVRDEG